MGYNEKYQHSIRTNFHTTLDINVLNKLRERAYMEGTNINVIIERLVRNMGMMEVQITHNIIL